MRLRNVPGSREAIADSPLAINEPKELKGKWNEEFGMMPEMTEIFLDQQKEIKHLLEEFGSINPGIAANIFKSVENVNLNTVIAYRTDTKLHSFLKDYK